jgi:hypothetical protein
MRLSDTFHLSYCPDLGVLTLRWLTDSTLPRLAAEYEQALAAAHLHGTAHWLLDVRQRPTADPEASRWVVFEWLPRVAATFPERLRLAVLAAPPRLEQVRTEPALQASAHEALHESPSYDLRLFADEAAATAWLTAETPEAVAPSLQMM